VRVRHFTGPAIDHHLGSQDQNGVASYYVSDHLGNITELTDAGGAITRTRRYDPWGRASAGGTDAGYAFTGREWDAEIGLYHYRARYYSAETGRFLSEDPIRFDAGPNFYAYTANNPLSAFDPLGLDWMEYTGQTLTLYGGKLGDTSKTLMQCKATSGGKGFQSPNYQHRPNEGPVPEGDYRINLMMDPTRVVRYTPDGQAYADYGIQRFDPYSEAWGSWRARLEKVKLNNPTPRDNFYLHDSEKGYTLGCIETCKDLYKRLADYRNRRSGRQDYMPVRVRYTTNSTNGGTAR
jgi:RHS repeat-associated protein